MPRVAVVTGFYNRGALLERTIDSILSQTFDDFELIVFDDASTDGTASRLRAIAERDARIRPIIHTTNTGFVRGLRQAIESSTAEYIAIQGSGDASLPGRLAAQVAVLDDRPEVGVVGGWYYNVMDELGLERLRRPDADDLTFERLLEGNLFSHGEVMIRRSFYDVVGGYREEFVNSQDYDLWLRIARVARFATVPAPVYDRHVQFDGVSFVPEKIVTQSCYSVAARRLATMDVEHERDALRMLREEGPTRLVSPADPAVQRKIEQAVLRLAFFGSPERAAVLAREVRDPFRRAMISAFVRGYTSRVAAPLHPLLERRLGIRPRERRLSPSPEAAP